MRESDCPCCKAFASSGGGKCGYHERNPEEQSKTATKEEKAKPSTLLTEAVFTEAHVDALRALAAKFVDSDSATVTKAEWEAVCAFVREGEEVLDARAELIRELQETHPAAPEVVAVVLLFVLAAIVVRHVRWRNRQYANHRDGLPHEHLWANSDRPATGSYFCEWQQECSVCGEREP